MKVHIEEEILQFVKNKEDTSWESKKWLQDQDSLSCCWKISSECGSSRQKQDVFQERLARLCAQGCQSFKCKQQNRSLWIDKACHWKVQILCHPTSGRELDARPPLQCSQRRLSRFFPSLRIKLDVGMHFLVLTANCLSCEASHPRGAYGMTSKYMQMEWRQKSFSRIWAWHLSRKLAASNPSITQRHILLSQQKSPNINKNQQIITNGSKPLGSRQWQERHQREQPPVPHPKVHVSFVQDSKEELAMLSHA